MSLLPRVQKKIDHQLGLSGKTLLAVSGGADSVALFRLCLDLELEFEVAHFNHQLRASSLEDARFVQALCEQHGVVFHLGQARVGEIAQEKGWNIEDAARTLRYGFLSRKAKDMGANSIFTAHTRNDQAETVLMQLFRGASHLTGIKPRNRQVFRPLLDIGRSELLVYLESLGQSFRTDETNFDLDLTRAWLRHELIPLIERRYPSLQMSLSRLAKVQRDELEFLNELATQMSENDTLETNKLHRLHMAVQRQILANWLGRHQLGVSFERVEALLTLAYSQTPKRLSLSTEKRARVAYGKLDLISSQSNKLVSQPVEDASQLPDGISPDLLRRYPDLTYRSRQPGDRMHLTGGSKKLSNILIDHKVPREERDGLRLLASGQQVFWVEGLLADPDAGTVEEDTDTAFMRRALEQAKLAAVKGELPVGAVLVCDGKVLAEAHNLCEETSDPSAHAELLVIRQAAIKQQDWRLSQAILYVTLEPCPMCFGALLQAHIPRLVFGAKNHREGAVGSVTDLSKAAWKRTIDVKAGVLENVCAALLTEFFARQRQS
ncbi:MAG: tRNA lysidine(34) synthetase TilS [Trueperaceae bacterium]|nr:tRNA lysidine(34) synthetase TilS [Trueperaceae bacterium]